MNTYSAHRSSLRADGTSGKKRGSILGVFSQLTGHGGIPYAGRQAAAVLASLADEYGMKCAILGLNDPADSGPLKVGNHAFRLRGFQGSKTGLIREVVAAAARVELAYFGHCALAPLAVALKIRPRTRYLVAGHGIEVWRRLPVLERLALRKASVITAPSRYTAQQMREWNKIAPAHVVVVPWGLDPLFDGRIALNGNRPPLPSGRILLAVSRLDSTERYKGIDSVIRAMPAVLRRVPDAHYVIVGDGGDRCRLENVAREAGVAAHTLFAGSRSDKEVAWYHAAADVYVMPSRKEGLGLVFLEAMACGKPVVAAAEAAAPEVISEGETGFLVRYDDVEALAERISRLLLDRALRQRMGAAGRRRFEQNYTFERFRHTLSELLHQCTTGGAVGSY